jgi:hypothetical protein
LTAGHLAENQTNPSGASWTELFSIQATSRKNSQGCQTSAIRSVCWRSRAPRFRETTLLECPCSRTRFPDCRRSRTNATDGPRPRGCLLASILPTCPACSRSCRSSPARARRQILGCRSWDRGSRERYFRRGYSSARHHGNHRHLHRFRPGSRHRRYLRVSPRYIRRHHGNHRRHLHVRRDHRAGRTQYSVRKQAQPMRGA